MIALQVQLPLLDDVALSRILDTRVRLHSKRYTPAHVLAADAVAALAAHYQAQGRHSLRRVFNLANRAEGQNVSGRSGSEIDVSGPTIQPLRAPATVSISSSSDSTSIILGVSSITVAPASRRTLSASASGFGPSPR